MLLRILPAEAQRNGIIESYQNYYSGTSDCELPVYWVGMERVSVQGIRRRCTWTAELCRHCAGSVAAIINAHCPMIWPSRLRLSRSALDTFPS